MTPRPHLQSLSNAIAWRATLWPKPEVDAGLLEDDWRSFAEIVASDAALEDWLNYEASFTPSLDRRGRAAYLVTDYCRLLAAAVVPLFLGYDHAIDMRPSKIAVRYSSKTIIHEGRDVDERHFQLRFLHSEDAGVFAGGRSIPVGSRREEFRLGLEGNLDGLIERLHVMANLSRSALWRLAGDAVAVAFLEAGRRLDCEKVAIGHAMAILKVPGSPFNNKQLGFFDIAIEDPAVPGREMLRRTFRARGGCCRYYTAEGGSLCSTCVLKDREKRDLDIENAMRRFLATGKVDH